jgi:hypothetical protein
MNCTSARAVFPELLDRRTPGSAHPEARVHLATCLECQRDFSALNQTLTALDAMPVPTPTPSLRKNFYAMLEEEKNSAASVRTAVTREGHTRRFSLVAWILSPVAACALVALGFFAGTRSTAPSPGANDATQRELASMREQISQQNAQLGKMTQLVGYQLLQHQQGPTNDRLREVLASARTAQPDDKVLDNLISALAFDPSSNVRLRALEALYAHAERPLVRSGVLASLPREQNPLVQIEMIDFLAAARNREAAPVLEKMSKNEAIDRSVRDAARRVLAQL